jgi:hypothetical protein
MVRPDIRHKKRIFSIGCRKDSPDSRRQKTRAASTPADKYRSICCNIILL